MIRGTRWIFFGAFSLVFLSVMIGIYLYNSSVIGLQMEPGKNATDMRISISDRLVLTWWLRRLGYTTPSITVVPLGTSDRWDVSNILVKFSDQIQPQYQTSNGQEIAASAGFNYDENSKTMGLTIQVKRSDKISDAQYHKALEFTLLDILYRIKADQQISPEDENQVWMSDFFKKKLTIFDFLGSNFWIPFSLVPVAYAQSCGGTFTCGSLVEACNTGGDCPGGSSTGDVCLGPGGWGTCNTSCNPDETSIFCSAAFSRSRSCSPDNSLCNYHSPGRCLYSNGCRISAPPPATPTPGGGGRPGPTRRPTPVPPTPPPSTPCTVQGFKVIMPGRTAAPSPIGNQPVLTDGGNPQISNPYFTSITGKHTISVPSLSDYTIGYTLCFNNTNCHNGVVTAGTAVTIDSAVNCPNGYADLWWHYSALPNCSTVSASINPVYINNPTTLTAQFTEPTLGGINLSGQFITGTNPTNISVVGSAVPVGGGSSWVGQYTWTPTAAGIVPVYCRAFNDGLTECRPPVFVDGPPRYDCVGPGLSTNVTVLNPTCSLTSLTCLPSPAQQGSTNLTCSAILSTLGGSTSQATWTDATPDVTVTSINPIINPKPGLITGNFSVSVSSGSPRTISLKAVFPPALGSNSCSTSANVIIVPASISWFQSGGGGDVIAAGVAARLKSIVPITLPLQYFLTTVAGISPKLTGAVFASNFSGVTDTNIDAPPTNDWKVDLTSANWTTVLSRPENTYDYMWQRLQAAAPGYIDIPDVDAANFGNSQLNSALSSAGSTSKITINPPGNFVTILHYGGGNTLNLSSTGLDLGSNKTIILTDSPVNILGPITFIDNSGFLAILAKGDISMSPNIGTIGDVDPTTLSPHIKGIYYSQGTVHTGTNGPLLDRQLRIDGSVIGMGGISLDRQIAPSATSSYPMEYFNYRPELTLIMDQVGPRRRIFQELINP